MIKFDIIEEDKSLSLSQFWWIDHHNKINGLFYYEDVFCLEFIVSFE